MKKPSNLKRSAATRVVSDDELSAVSGGGFWYVVGKLWSYIDDGSNYDPNDDSDKNDAVGVRG